MVDTLYNPFTGADEIMVRDAQGGMRALRADAAIPAPPSAPVPLRPMSPPPLPASPPPRPVAVEGGDIVAVSRSLAAAADVTLDDPILVRRLVNVVISRVKDIRSQIEMLEILRRPVKIGGLGIEPAAAEKLGRIIELQLPKLAGRNWAVPPPPPPGAVSVTPPPAVVRPSPAVAAGVTAPALPRPTPAAVIASTPRRPAEPPPLPAPVRSAVVAVGTHPPLAPIQPVVVRVPPPPQSAVPRPASAPAPATLPPVARPMPLPPATPPPMVAPQLVVAQPVTPTPTVRAAQPPPAAPPAPPVTPSVPPPAREQISARGGQTPAGSPLVGTVEELGRFTLVDFRRLDPAPAIAAAKIHALFNALERESFARRAAGLAAWRGSELYALYTAMGSESMTAKQPMEAVAAQRVARGQPALTLAEFEAIMDLNQQLRF